MKRILILLMMIVSTDSFATGIDSNSNTAPCDNATLSKYSGTVNAEINWEPNTISLNWYDGDEKLTVANNAQSCTYDGTLTVPPQPTKPGYTFNGWKVIPVPGGSKRIEYLENNGTESQYIDTGVPGDNNNYRIVIDFMALSLDNGGSNTIFTNDPEDSSTNVWRLLFYNNYFIMFYTNTEAWNPRVFYTGTPYFQLNQRYLIDMNYNDATVNGTKYIYDRLSVGKTNNKAIRLFGHPQRKRIYSFAIYENGNLIRDMIPAKDSNDVPCMYDKITGQFFYNAGTGNFIAGPEVQ